MKMYITHLLQKLNFSSPFRRFEMKNSLRRSTMVADNISNLVAPPPPTLPSPPPPRIFFHFYGPENYDRKSLSQHFSKEIYQYVNITWLLFLILSIAKFLREPILKNVGERLLLKMCS